MEDNLNLEKFANALTEENYTEAQLELSKLEKNFTKNFFWIDKGISIYDCYICYENPSRRYEPTLTLSF